jgi:hypothetical protein
MGELGREIKTIVIEPVVLPVPDESPNPTPETEPSIQEEEPART